MIITSYAWYGYKYNENLQTLHMQNIKWLNIAIATVVAVDEENKKQKQVVRVAICALQLHSFMYTVILCGYNT